MNSKFLPIIKKMKNRVKDQCNQDNKKDNKLCGLLHVLDVYGLVIKLNLAKVTKSKILIHFGCHKTKTLLNLNHLGKLHGGHHSLTSLAFIGYLVNLLINKIVFY